MKHTLFIFAILTATIQTFAQSPRIKLNQITKDSVTGSVLISSPTDSGMVYSRDLFISYGVSDTVLILGGDTLAATSNIISSVLSDGVTITGDGTIGSELTADTSVLATLRALSDSLALVISSVTADNVTITGDGTVGSPLEVDTATVVSSVGRLLDSLVNVRTDLDLKQDQLNGTGFVKATGTTITYDNSTYLTSEVDGSVTNEIQDISTTGAAGNISISSGSTLNLNVDDADASASNELQTLSYNSSTNEITLSDGGGTEDLSNLDLVDSTRINATGDTAYYYQNGVLIGTGPIAGGGTTYNNITEGNDTVYISDHLNVDTSTLFVDAVNNRVGIGTSTPNSPLDISVPNTNPGGTQWLGINQTGGDGYFQIGSGTGATGSFISVFEMQSEGFDEYVASFVGKLPEVNDVNNANILAALLFAAYEKNSDGSVGALENADLFSFTNYTTVVMKIEADGDVVIPSLASISNIDADANGRLYDASDESLKNIIKTKTNGLSELLNIEPIYFTWKDVSRFSPETFIGFSAQNVEQALPEAAYRVPSKGYMSVRTDAILATAVVSIQEQQSIIESQATEIEQLKTLITELSNRLTILENN